MKMSMVLQEEEDKTLTTDAYVSILKVQLGKKLKVSVIIKNEHVSSALSYKVLESNDEVGADGTWHESTAETHLNAGLTAKVTCDPAPTWIEVQAIRKQITTPVDSKISVWMKGVGL